VWQEPDVIREDLDRIGATRCVPWHVLHDRTVLVTGATGLIGRTLIKALLWYSLGHDAGLRVVALVRNAEGARQVFSAPLAAGAPLSFVEGDVQTMPALKEPVQFVVHGASVTASRNFIMTPAETISTTVRGTERVLEYARDEQVESLVYLSTVEVYGAPDGTRLLGETDLLGFDPLVVRNCYPESKRMAEAMCAAYAAQHGVPAKVLRPTLTFGPGLPQQEERVFAQFARCAAEGRDIVLHTKGETKRSYLYTADAVTAVLTVLLAGLDGQAYNAANEATYCSVREMAELVAETCADGRIAVRVESRDLATSGYAPTLQMNVDTTRLQALGWQPTIGLADMYRRMIATL
jgi:nucleoside-diphosphate-sugar epimerase